MKVNFVILSLVVLGAAIVHPREPAPGPQMLTGKNNQLKQSGQDFWKALSLLELGDAATYEEGRGYLERAANEENVYAQYYLGMSYRFGQYGFKKNDKRAASWFRFAAERGNGYAMAHLGQLYFLGEGVRKSKKQAWKWLEAALGDSADFVTPPPPAHLRDRYLEQNEKVEVVGEIPPSTAQEDILAMTHYLLAQLLQEEESYAEAQEHYLAAAKMGKDGRAGIPDAAVQAAVNFAFGQGVQRDLKEGETLLSLSERLRRQQGISFSHTLLKAKELDAFAVSDFQEFLDDVNNEVSLGIHVEIADELSDVDSDFYDLDAALKWYRLAAERGNVSASLKLGLLYGAGDTDIRDFEEALSWFERVSDVSGLAAANAGIMYQYGMGVESDLEKADVLFQSFRDQQVICYLGSEGKAPNALVSMSASRKLGESLARKGDSHARFLLGWGYHIGDGYEVDEKKARYWYRKAADKGHAKAQFFLASFYMADRTKDKDFVKGLELLLESAESGELSANYDLAFFFEEAGYAEVALSYIERCFEIDPDEPMSCNMAAVLYERKLAGMPIPSWIIPRSRIAKFLAEMGHPLESRRQYRKRVWTDEEKKRLVDQMFTYLRKSDELGHAVASFNLGRHYYVGEFVEKDYEQAYLYFQTAVEGGYPLANRYLGHMHFFGFGVPVTLEEAAYYYRLAALDGDLESLQKVCEAYLNGRGVSRDLERAAFWIALLVQAGDEKALLQYASILMEQKKHGEARELYQQLANHPSRNIRADALYSLGDIYFEGIGIEKDHELSREYYLRAQVHGSSRGHVSEAKQHIIAHNYEMSIPLLDLAASKGNPEALYLLGFLYFKGLGVEKSSPVAIQYATESADAGYAPAKLSLALSALQNLEGAPDLSVAIQYAKEAEEADVERADMIRRKLEERFEKEPRQESAGNPKSS